MPALSLGFMAKTRNGGGGGDLAQKIPAAPAAVAEEEAAAPAAVAEAPAALEELTQKGSDLAHRDSEPDRV